MADEEKKRPEWYFSNLETAEQAALAANRIMREVPNYRAEPSVQGEGPNLERALELHVKPHMKLIEKYATRSGIEPQLLASIIAVEQRGNPTKNTYKKSDKGAAGIAQLMPVVRETYHINPDSVEDSIRGAAEYLADMKKQFGDDYAVLGAAYHSGDTQVRHLNQQHREVGPRTREYAALMDIMNERMNPTKKLDTHLKMTNPTQNLREALPEKPLPKKPTTFDEAVAILKAKP